MQIPNENSKPKRRLYAFKESDDKFNSINVTSVPHINSISTNEEHECSSIFDESMSEVHFRIDTSLDKDILRCSTPNNLDSSDDLKDFSEFPLDISRIDNRIEFLTAMSLINHSTTNPKNDTNESMDISLGHFRISSFQDHEDKENNL
ncbi:hypothetical protein GJ496_004790 [Pomphorhynchus laevis]|nr:hypothetical protein GJ496_004790 [Pomphorhynchus laevis]